MLSPPRNILRMHDTKFCNDDLAIEIPKKEYPFKYLRNNAIHAL